MSNVGLREWNGFGTLTAVGGFGDFSGAACVPVDEFDVWARQVSFGAGYNMDGFGYLIGEQNCRD
jgi:hypothetical protein